MQHLVKLAHLEPDTVYYYRVGDGTEENTCAPFERRVYAMVQMRTATAACDCRVRPPHAPWGAGLRAAEANHRRLLLTLKGDSASLCLPCCPLLHLD